MDRVERIEDGLKEWGVDHSHLTPNNICLVFERTANGKPDITKPPRVYAIDFDRAIYKEKAA